MTQLALLPDEITLAIRALEKARKAKKGKIGLYQKRLNDLVRADLEKEFPKGARPTKEGHTWVDGHFCSLSADISLPLGA